MEVNPIAFGDLPEDERALVRTALEEGEYAVESGEEPPALDAFWDRVEERAGGTLTVSLERNGTYYRVGLAEGDHIIAYADGDPVDVGTLVVDAAS